MLSVSLQNDDPSHPKKSMAFSPSSLYCDKNNWNKILTRMKKSMKIGFFFKFRTKLFCVFRYR